MMQRFSPLLLALLAVAVPSGPTPAQGRGPGPVQLEPFDWGVTAAWRRRAAQVRTTRAQLLRQGNFAALNAVRGGSGRLPFIMGQLPTSAVTGAFHVPVIPVGYRDVPAQASTATFQCLLFSRDPVSCGNPSPRPYSVTTFYEQLSHQRITLDGVVFPAAQLDSNAVYYTAGCYGIGAAGTTCADGLFKRMARMLLAALDSVNNRPDGNTLWAQFDNDGADGIPNSGDDDGIVDFVTFLQPEIGGECQSNTPKPTGIWSHRYVIAAVSSQLGHPRIDGAGRYVTRTPSNSTRQGAPPFIVVNDYTIQSQVGGITSCLGNEIMGIGTIAHETGHAFGLPDLYDTSPLTQGIGGWGLMGSGNYARPYSPSSFDAWSLHALGWAVLDTLSGSRTVTTGARQVSDTIFYARTDNPDEYLLVENRQAVLSDTAHMNPGLPATCPLVGFGFCAKSPGLLLWLINQPKISSGLLSNTVNSGSLQGVELIQADGLNELRLNGSKNRGDRGDAYPGGTNNTRFSLLSTPAARNHDGNYIGFILDQIQQFGDGQVSFRFLRRGPTVIQGQGGALISVNGVPWTRFEEVLAGGEQLQLGAEALQLLAGGKSRARFLAWSQGGAMEQSFTTSLAGPDTLTASFAVEHRLRVSVSGGGTISTGVTGDLSQGVFLTEGSRVTLTAVPPQGALFTGWRGDTLATEPELVLDLTKGFDLEARFIGQLVVAPENAASDLLGTPTLSAAERSFLDELGNRNGIFDVGDLLALYRRLGQAAPPAAQVARPARRP